MTLRGMRGWGCLLSIRRGDDGTRGDDTSEAPQAAPQSRPRLRLESNLTLRHIRHSWRMLSGSDPGIEHSHWSREEIEPSDWMNNCVLLMT